MQYKSSLQRPELGIESKFDLIKLSHRIRKLGFQEANLESVREKQLIVENTPLS